MKIFHSLDPESRKMTAGSVLAIGIFDGFHRGHQKIINSVVREARKTKLPAGVMTFFPHPEKTLNHRSIPHIQTLSQRLNYLSSAGLDYCLILSLESELACLSGEEFAGKILAEKLRVSQVIVGENFRFGYQRKSSASDLKSMGKKLGFKVRILKRVIHKGLPVSSSLIRKLLLAGRVDQANALLGHPYEINGQVIKGREIGQKLGFPTANLKTENEILPRGVFLALSEYQERWWPSLLNIGFRPTFNGKELSIEVFLLDFSGELYGQQLRLQLFKKLRSEKKFKSPEALKKQIARDIEKARQLFKKHHISSEVLL